MAVKKKKTKQRKGSGRRGSAKARRRNRFRRWSVIVALLLLAGLAGSLWHLDRTIRSRFEGKRWDLPARVYARPLELFPGLPLTQGQLVEELRLAGYRQARSAPHPGSYARRDNTVRLYSRAFDFGGGDDEPAHRLTVTFDHDTVTGLTEGNGRACRLARLDPVQIGSFHPRRYEDRIVVKRSAIPNLLRRTLLAVEDRNFYSHHGVDPLAILRAILVNLKAGGTVQGGSTLTQQLVKNFFLDNRRTLWRKVNEAAMALLLELHYDKEEILTAYINEVFLGQDGNRAVHGFALAGHFYFRRDLADLSPAQIALLVGLVKGPSYYDPRLHPERAFKRRNVVLKVMAREGLISAAQQRTASAAPVMEPAALSSAINRFPAFLDLIKRELLKEYREADLTDDGIRILTTLDPLVQRRVEQTLERTVPRLERGRNKEAELQAAVVVVHRDSGEIEALAGDRRSGFAGFNRALDARRPIGSLVKPAVYLTALEQGFTLASPLADRNISLTGPTGKKWQPQNFDHREHGEVPLFRALAHSYNLATVRLGMKVGVERVVQTIEQLGAPRPIKPYPSVLLGAVDMAPLEVAQLYLTLADGGFHTPLRGIRSVLAADGRPLKRYGLTVEQRFDPATVFLLNNALAQVVADGTGRSLKTMLPQAAAGKTGTSDDLRDSWFAGFTDDRVAVTWLGRDDNRSTGLTGATGALQVWGRIMAAIHTQPLELTPPPGISWARVSPNQYQGSDQESWTAVTLPFREGKVPANLKTVPEQRPAVRPLPGLIDRIKKIFSW